MGSSLGKYSVHTCPSPYSLDRSFWKSSLSFSEIPDLPIDPILPRAANISNIITFGFLPSLSHSPPFFPLDSWDNFQVYYLHQTPNLRLHFERTPRQDIIYWKWWHEFLRWFTSLMNITPNVNMVYMALNNLVPWLLFNHSQLFCIHCVPAISNNI